MYLNSATIVGRMTKDPEIKALQSGEKVCGFSIATNYTYTDKDGKKVEKPEFHNIVCFGRIAETSGQFLKKGQLVLVTGRLQTRTWDKEDGSKAYRTEIVASHVQFGPKASGASEPGSAMRPAVVPKGQARADDQIEYPTEDINPDDIPF